MSAYKGLTAEQMKLVDQFKSRLQALNVEEFKLDSSNFVMRYLKTNKFNLDKAEDNVHEYLMALKKYNAKEVIDAKFPQEFAEQFTTYIGGHDNEGRPSKQMFFTSSSHQSIAFTNTPLTNSYSFS